MEKENFKLQIRLASNSDIPALSQLFRETICSVNQKDYSHEEVLDWASCGESRERWEELIHSLYFIVAINDKNNIIGFASLSESGYLHSMFVHKNFQGQGIANRLYTLIEEEAQKQNIKKITSEVSITARSFFERKGFVLDEKQQRKANKLYLTNFKMSKRLD